jgi:hypothetical protein
MSKYKTKWEREEAVSGWIVKWFFVPLIIACALALLYGLPIGILVDLGWNGAWGMVIWLGISVAVTIAGTWAFFWVRKGE